MNRPSREFGFSLDSGPVFLILRPSAFSAGSTRLASPGAWRREVKVKPSFWEHLAIKGVKALSSRWGPIWELETCGAEKAVLWREDGDGPPSTVPQQNQMSSAQKRSASTNAVRCGCFLARTGDLGLGS